MRRYLRFFQELLPVPDLARPLKCHLQHPEAPQIKQLGLLVRKLDDPMLLYQAILLLVVETSLRHLLKELQCL
jgi:hypothetical protein